MTRLDVVRVMDALAHLQNARDALAVADCPAALTRVRSAIKSTEGALRHVQRRYRAGLPTGPVVDADGFLVVDAADVKTAGQYMVNVELESGERVRTATVHPNRTSASIQARKIIDGGFYRGQRVVATGVERDMRPPAVIAAQNATAAR